MAGFVARSERNKLWFGTVERACWFPTPLRGAGAPTVGWESGGTLLNGGGFQQNSYGSHKEYVFEWSGVSSQEALSVLQSYASGSYGRGLIYFHDPLSYAINVLPSQWADPSVGVGYEGASLVYNVYPTATVTASRDVNDLPVQSAVFDLSEISEGWRGEHDALYVPIPEGHALALGAFYSATGSGGIFYRTVTSAGALGSVERLTELGNGSESVVNETISGAGISGVYLWIGKSSSGGASVTVSGMVGRLLLDKNLVSVLRFTNVYANSSFEAGSGSLVTVATNLFTNPDLVGDGAGGVREIIGGEALPGGGLHVPENEYAVLSNSTLSTVMLEGSGAVAVVEDSLPEIVNYAPQIEGSGSWAEVARNLAKNPAVVSSANMASYGGAGASSLFSPNQVVEGFPTATAGVLTWNVGSSNSDGGIAQTNISVTPGETIYPSAYVRVNNLQRMRIVLTYRLAGTIVGGSIPGLSEDIVPNTVTKLEFSPEGHVVPDGVDEVLIRAYAGGGGNARPWTTDDVLEATAFSTSRYGYLDGSTLPDVSQPEDFRTRWLGAENESESVLEIERVRGLTGVRSIAGVSSIDGKPAVRQIPTDPTSNNSYMRFDIPAEARSGGTLIGTMHQIAPLTGALFVRNRTLRVVSPEVDLLPVPANVAGSAKLRLAYESVTSSYIAVFMHGGYPGSGDVWWTDIGLFEGDYDDPFFDGDTGFIEIDGTTYVTKWNPNSTSTATPITDILPDPTRFETDQNVILLEGDWTKAGRFTPGYQGNLFSGANTPSGDYEYAWTGTPNQSTSEQKAEGLPNITNGFQSKEWAYEGFHSLYVTDLESFPISTPSTVVVVARNSGQTLDTDTETITSGESNATLRANATSTFTLSRGWWDVLTIVEQPDYQGDPFTGDTGTIRAGSESLKTNWAGAPNDSPSEARTKTPELDRVKRGPWLAGQGHSGVRMVGHPTKTLNGPFNGGQVGFAATFREVGHWVSG